MIGLGTLINCAAIIVGGILGMLFNKRLNTRFQNILTDAVGIAVIFIGAAGAFEKMLTVSGGALHAGGTYMIIASLCIGGILGEAVNFDKRAVNLGDFLKRKFKSEKDNGFTAGFVNASLTVCIGAMAIVGALEDGINGNYTILLTKGILDFIIVMVLSAHYGKGCMFSAIPVFVLQGGITLIAKWISPLLTAGAVENISLVGSILIFLVGINLVFDRKIKVANLVPALIIAAAWSFLPFAQ